MTGPDAVPPREALAAIARVRAGGDSLEVDDEVLAALVDGGIEAVEPAARAEVLRAIGHSPALAALVAELAATRSGSEVVTDRAFLGVSRGAWRLAWVACALLAVPLTAWMLAGAPESREGAAVALLQNASQGPTEQPGRFSEWFAGTPVRVLVAGLWVTFCLLAVPAFGPSRSPAGRRPGGAA